MLQFGLDSCPLLQWISSFVIFLMMMHVYVCNFLKNACVHFHNVCVYIFCMYMHFFYVCMCMCVFSIYDCVQDFCKTNYNQLLNILIISLVLVDIHQKVYTSKLYCAGFYCFHFQMSVLYLIVCVLCLHLQKKNYAEIFCRIDGKHLESYTPRQIKKRSFVNILHVICCQCIQNHC